MIIITWAFLCIREVEEGKKTSIYIISFVLWLFNLSRSSCERTRFAFSLFFIFICATIIDVIHIHIHTQEPLFVSFNFFSSLHVGFLLLCFRYIFHHLEFIYFVFSNPLNVLIFIFITHYMYIFLC